MARWRHSFYKLVPSWLSTGDGEKVLHTLGRLTDGYLERVRQSLTARFPSYAGPTGLRLLGTERGIVRGRAESNAGYARRLQGWRGPRGHLTRGSAYAMLRQIWHYFGGIKAQELDPGGNVYTVLRDGTESATHGGAWDWDAPLWPTRVSGIDDDPPAHDADAADDLGDGPDIGAVAVSPGATKIITVNCDGTPGQLIFIHVNTGRNTGSLVANTITVDQDGWTELDSQTANTGTGSPYHHVVFYKVVPPGEYFTSVDIACTNGDVSGLSDRFIARAVNVPGVYDADPIVAVAKSTDSGVTVATPEVPAYTIDTLVLAFIACRVGDVQPVSTPVGAFTEIGAQRTAGGTGVAIDEQWITAAKDVGIPAGTVRVGTATSAVSVIMVSIRQRQPWYRFWLKLVPAADQGIASWGTWAADETRGTGTWADGENETWGQTGVTPGDARAIRDLYRGARPWKMAGTKAEWLICVLGQDEAHAPDGTWRYWTTDGAPTRYAGWRYWKL